MKETLYIFFIVGLFSSFIGVEGININDWRDYPACRLGRLQSPIEIIETDSTYTNDFSFVYQNYNPSNYSINISDISNYAFSSNNIQNGGYINFERGGVIKQYQLIRFELYPGLHKIDGEYEDYELHIIHKKNLDFKTNKNQYRRIQDPNMYLVVVLRYIKNCTANENIKCSPDDQLLYKLTKGKEINLNHYSFIQDKRAYFYEGSFLHIPCDENVNYYIVKDFFYPLNVSEKDLEFSYSNKNISLAHKFGRPIFKNFMNYKEVMNSKLVSYKILTLFLLIFIIL